MKRRRGEARTGTVLLVALLLGMLGLALGGCGGAAPAPSPGATVSPTATERPAAPGPTGTAEAGSTPEVEGRGTGLRWTRLSSQNGDLPAPGTAAQQTSALILDVDRDGLNDFVIGSKEGGASLLWYRRGADGWDLYTMEEETLNIAAGGTALDADGDGDLDVVMGGGPGSSSVWWWQNPYPDYDPGQGWARHEIKNSGSGKHHDQLAGDFDGDGQAELAFWNQRAQRLLLAEIPTDPAGQLGPAGAWPTEEIWSWDSGEYEGLAAADVNNDGKVDIVGGGHWFEHAGGAIYTAHPIDEEQAMSRAAAGQLVAGGWAEVVLVPGDGTGPMRWYEWTGSDWTGHDLLGAEVDHGHSLQVADMDGDGHLDIFVAEMRLDGGNEDAGMWVLLGDGQGAFEVTEVARGYGNHESKVGDLDGDGDLDILGKPYNWETPRLDVWLSGGELGLDRWQRHVVDEARPWRAIFVTAADLDGDGWTDVVTGGWWYRNPGSPGGDWQRLAIGEPLNNMAAVADLDGDGDADVLGTQGQGSEGNAEFAWARNEGGGAFTLLENIEEGDGDFLQGAAVGRFQDGGGLGVALSWHRTGKGVQLLRVPAGPAGSDWTVEVLSPVSQDEGLSAGDVDGDGAVDLLLGTQWLRNEAGSWTAYAISDTQEPPDRNRLADMNGDGRLDAVVGFEAVSEPGRVVWYEQGNPAISPWTEHPIATVTGPMSLDVADMDGDGDLDVVVGEHNKEAPDQASLYLFENEDGLGDAWRQHLVHTGDEHHDGAQVVDIDNDGDLDILSIGWDHDAVLLYENLALPAAAD